MRTYHIDVARPYVIAVVRFLIWTVLQKELIELEDKMLR